MVAVAPTRERVLKHGSVYWNTGACIETGVLKMTKKRKPPNRRPASRYIVVIDDLLLAQQVSGATKVVLAELIGIEYTTLDKYLKKERNVCEHEIAKRMVVTTNLLNEIVDKGKLPVPPETSHRLKSGVVMELINDYLTQERTYESTN